MQKIATRIFMGASVAFGILGIVIVITLVNSGDSNSGFDRVLVKLFMTTVFIILPSFALSVAGKYLSSK